MAGEKGFSVFSIVGDAQAAVILQHRALDPGSALSSTNVPISLVTDVNISFCPWCGSSLPEFYGQRKNALERTELRIPLGK